MTAAPALHLRPFDTTTDYEPIAALVTATNEADNFEWVMTAASLRSNVALKGHYHPERDVRHQTFGIYRREL